MINMNINMNVVVVVVDDQNISPLCDAYYQDVVNCLLEATFHIHDSIRTKAVRFAIIIDSTIKLNHISKY